VCVLLECVLEPPAQLSTCGPSVSSAIHKHTHTLSLTHTHTVCVCLLVYVCMYVCMYMYVYAVCVSVCVCVCVLYKCTPIFSPMHRNLHARTHARTHTHTHMHTTPCAATGWLLALACMRVLSVSRGWSLKFLEKSAPHYIYQIKAKMAYFCELLQKRH